MNRIRSLALAVFVAAISGSGFAQGPILAYINFDGQTDGAVSVTETTYTISGPEVLNPVGGLTTVRAHYVNTAGTGPVIGTPSGISGTSQGGKALLLNGGPTQVSGLVLSANTFLPEQDFTFEALWYTSDTLAAGNTAGIQTIWSNEWPSGNTSQFFIRTVPPATQFWTDRGDSQQEGTTTTLPAANTWVHDVMVFDLNDGNQALSTVSAYRNGTLINTFTYNAAVNAGIALFADGPPAKPRSIGIGDGLGSLYISGTGDPRGLRGGIDAIAISLGLRTPANFILPAGPASGATDWSLYR